MWNELFGAKRSEFCLYVGESMATVHDLLMLAGLTMRGGQKRKEGRKEGGMSYLSLPYPDSELGR